MPAQPRTVPPDDVDGILDLPPGKIAAVATYLEMHAPPVAPPPGDGADWRFERIGRDIRRYRALYGEVGEPWLWFSRALMTDAQLGAIIRHPDVEALAFVRDGRDRGIVELDFRRDGECELCFLGLAPAATGRGEGRILAAEAIGRAFARPIRRLWLHTCTLDHPGAVAFYIREGFRPYRRAIEVADDPRVAGRMPRGAGAGFPIV